MVFCALRGGAPASPVVEHHVLRRCAIEVGHGRGCQGRAGLLLGILLVKLIDVEVDSVEIYRCCPQCLIQDV